MMASALGTLSPVSHTFVGSQAFYPLLWLNIYMDKFTARLKELRQEKGLSQIQLAKETGISKSAIGFWETGERVPGVNYEICDKKDILRRKLLPTIRANGKMGKIEGKK